MNTQITEFTKTEVALTVLEEKYAHVPDATTEDGYTACVEAIRELRPLRTGLDKMRLQLNADDQARIKFRNTEAKRITGRLTALEGPIKAAKVAVDTEKERIEEEARQAEMKRISDITTKIENMSNLINMLSPASPSDDIQKRFVAAQSVTITGAEYGEYVEPARAEQQRVIEVLETAYKERFEYEEGQAELKRQQAAQAAIAAQQAEAQAKLDAERKAIETQQAEIEAEKRRQEQAKLDEYQRLREEKEAAERAEKERLQAELDAKEKAEREAKAEGERIIAAEAEAARQEALRPDKEKVHDWAAKLRFIDGPSGVTNKQCQLIVTEALTELADISEAAMKQVDMI